ncbi:hypothetical protein [Streptomyces montanisoli]|uniref:Uncharacterized protein n=1 Tax=Streptomyces montanisoli TaxID=2798581 RepID=A0A940M953_9ACTN|nr:hypothetical protein [Streptomyces montanisoli]MBP0456643.1 hypothetical protein [Streptomyces montanisoli]
MNGYDLTEPLDVDAAEKLVLATAQSQIEHETVAALLEGFVKRGTLL